MTALYIVIGIVAVLFAVIASRPSQFRTERSTVISAPASVIFPHVHNLKSFNVWNPWAKIDPNAKMTFEGPAEGVGSSMHWDGNNEVGKGSMTLTENRPHELVQFSMDFFKPMQATNIAEFTFKPEGNQTRVTWVMYGKNTFMGKALSLIINCDKMVGDQFEKGLASLKAIVESR